MRKQLKRKYRTVRHEFKGDLDELLRENPVLALLIDQIYINRYNRRLHHKVWHFIGTKNRSLYREMGNAGLINAMGGRYDEFFHIFYFVDKEFVLKYRGQIPENVALGDAVGMSRKYLKMLEVLSREPEEWM